MAITWGAIGVYLAVVLVLGSLIAAFVDAWWEKRKWDKHKEG